MGKILSLREKQVEFGVFYHKFLRSMTDKYGTDYRQRHLIDLCKFTDEELRQFCSLYEEMMLARGRSKQKIYQCLTDSIGYAVERGGAR